MHPELIDGLETLRLRLLNEEETINMEAQYMVQDLMFDMSKEEAEAETAATKQWAKHRAGEPPKTIIF